jgi:hypothetical protein
MFESSVTEIKFILFLIRVDSVYRFLRCCDYELVFKISIVYYVLVE